MLRGELEFIHNHDASDNNRLLTDLLLDRLVAPSSFHWPKQFHCFAGLDNDRQFLSSRNWLSLLLPITNQPFECSDHSLDPVAISDLLHGIDQSVWTRILLGVLAGSDPPQRLYETRCSKLEINHYFVNAYLSDCPTRFGRVDRSYRHCRRSISSSTQFSRTAAVTEGTTEAKLPEDDPPHSFESCSGIYLEPIRGNFFKELTGPKSDANSTGNRQHLSGFLQLLGNYGWLSERLPNEIYALFSSILILIFALVAIVGSEPFRRAFLLTICSAFCLLFLGSALRPGYLQGRYFFPGFAFGVVCASYALNERFDQLSKQASARLFGLGATALSILHLVSFFEVAKRFSDGSSSSFPNAISSQVGLVQLPIFAYLCIYAFGLLLVFNSLRNFKKSPL